MEPPRLPGQVPAFSSGPAGWTLISIPAILLQDDLVPDPVVEMRDWNEKYS